MHITLKKSLGMGSIVLIVGIIIFYAYYQSRAIVAGPQLTITSPEHGMTATSSLVTVRGVATHAKEITLQGRSVFIDLEGNFTKELLLAEGYNIIELTAQDTQGRQITKTIELTYHAPQNIITP